MKHLPWIALILASLLAMETPAYAHNPCHPQQESYSDSIIHKFSRGFANATTGWVELPKNIVNESKATNVGYGITIGLFQGVIHTVGRTLIGVVELGTFLIPNNEFIHPRYVWSPFEQKTSYGSTK